MSALDREDHGLRHLRVTEVSKGLMAGYCGRLFADLGAEVRRVLTRAVVEDLQLVRERALQGLPLLVEDDPATMEASPPEAADDAPLTTLKSPPTP